MGMQISPITEVDGVVVIAYGFADVLSPVEQSECLSDCRREPLAAVASI